MYSVRLQGQHSHVWKTNAGLPGPWGHWQNLKLFVRVALQHPLQGPETIFSGRISAHAQTQTLALR